MPRTTKSDDLRWVPEHAIDLDCAYWQNRFVDWAHVIDRGHEMRFARCRASAPLIFRGRAVYASDWYAAAADNLRTEDRATFEWLVMMGIAGTLRGKAQEQGFRDLAMKQEPRGLWLLLHPPKILVGR